MKTTKIVEIELCDSCCEEQGWLDKCAKCGKEICSECTEYIHVRAQCVTPQRRDGQKSITVRQLNLKSSFSTRYCSACGGGISEALLASGFVEEPEKDA